VRRTAAKLRIRRLQRLLPEPPCAPIPADVAEAAWDAGIAVALRTGLCGGDENPGSVVNRAMVDVMQERLAALERGDTAPWIQLTTNGWIKDVCVGDPDDKLSTDPAAIAELDRILEAVGYDAATEPKQRIATRPRTNPRSIARAL
jgi:hypothetical protein